MTATITNIDLHGLWKTLRGNPDMDGLLRFAPLIEHDLHVRDAVVLAAIDPRVDEDDFLALARRPGLASTRRRMNERLEGLFDDPGSMDQTSVRNMAMLFQRVGGADTPVPGARRRRVPRLERGRPVPRRRLRLPGAGDRRVLHARRDRGRGHPPWGAMAAA